MSMITMALWVGGGGGGGGDKVLMWETPVGSDRSACGDSVWLLEVPQLESKST